MTKKAKKTKRNPHTGQKAVDLAALVAEDAKEGRKERRHLLEYPDYEEARAYIVELFKQEALAGKQLITNSKIAANILKHFGQKISTNAVYNYILKHHHDHWKAYRGQ